MNLVIPALAGFGLALFAAGLPPLNRTRLATRVDPYLNGLGGQPSSLLPRDRRGFFRIHAHAVSRLLAFDVRSIRDRLVAAGREQSPEDFRVDQVVCAAIGMSIAAGIAVAAGLLGSGLAPGTVLVLGPVAGAVGWAAKDRSLSRAVSKRRDAVRQELPVALDLLTLSIMAGESVPQAFARVGAMLGGVVGHGFSTVVASIRVGSPLVEALQDLSPRLPDPGVGRLIDSLCAGIERGAPLAETLRAQADDLRQARHRELLESGGRREILMLVPVVFLILPTVVAFTLLPGLVSLDLLVP